MFISHNTGWLGIDVGTSTVKVAQLVRKNNRMQVAAKVIVPRRDLWQRPASTDAEPISSLDEFRTAASLLGGSRGRKAAGVLSMALCGLHRLDQPPGAGPGQAASLRQALEMETQGSTEHLQYGCWSAAAIQDGAVSTNVLTVHRTWTDQLYDDIAQIGWSCQLIDGLPLALARAVQLVQQDVSGAPLAALDLGFGQATFCTVIDGQPAYVRSLKGCGFEKLLRCISEELNLTLEEAQRLLVEHGIAAEPGEKLSETGEVLRELADDFLEQLVQEMSRTVAYLKGQRQSIQPKHVYLFGGGSTVKGLAAYLGQASQTNVVVWQFGNEPAGSRENAAPTCLLGPAIALSALAWEQS
ncbi:MAG: pilus assembly protein PilM [Pirellulales bacterium]|nr:pilus assembly protein PilM [Pirellulales bacterium]